MNYQFQGSVTFFEPILSGFSPPVPTVTAGAVSGIP